MKKLSILGKFLKYGSFMVLALGLCKIVTTVIYGYKRVDPTYGGAYFYNWSAVYIDDKLPKTLYLANKLSEQPKNDSFKRYVDMVQTKGRKDESIYPYYAYGLPDTHVLSPSKTWTIFKTKEQMDREFMFLDMRGRFISMMYDVKFDSKGPFFVEAGDKDGKKGEKTVGKPLLKTPYFKKIDEAKVRSFFSDRANNEVIQSKDFEVIVKNIIANKKDYGVKYLDGKAKMTPEFEKDVMRVVDQAFKGFGVNADMVNGFFQRVSTLLLTPMDVHIINRIKLYFFYTNSYLSMDGVTNKEYAKQKVVYDELKSKKDKGEELDKDKTRKMNNANSRMHAERMRMICNKASMLFASILGDRGVILEKDDRNLLRSFGGPHVATMKNMKKKEREDLTIFDGQMRKYYAVS